mgnify:CR=1 FL=1
MKSQVVCPVELALRMLGGKWRGSILYQLQYGPLRFTALKNRVQDGVVDYDGSENYLSNKVLSGHLNALLDFQLIRKTENGDGNVHYELSDNGLSVMPILIDLFYWGEKQV